MKLTLPPTDAFAPPPRVNHLAVTLWLDPHQRHFRGELVAELVLDTATRTLPLRAEGLRFSDCHARIDGQRVRLSARPGSDASLLLIAREPLRAGEAHLHLAWAGAINTRPEGIWRADFGPRSALIGWLADGGMQRVLPCIDAPGQRACHTLTLHVPVGLGAVASSRLLDRRSVGAEVCWRFATTPPIPTRALGFAVGAFEIEDGPQTPTPIRVLAPRGALDTQQPAGAVAEQLTALEALFGHRQAYGKLDLLVVPGLPRAAITLPGLVMCRPAALAPEALAHALARLWTGLLVSPAAEDRWLADALATTAARMVVADRALTHTAIAARRSAMNLDALPEPAPHPFRDVALLEMIARHMGAEAFTAALRRFIRRHAHQSATCADLCSALHDPTAATIADELLGHRGLLLVEGQLSEDRELRLVQSRYADPSAPTSTTLPVQLQIGAGTQTATLRCVMRGPIATLSLPFRPEWIHLNAEQSGYYRWIGPTEQIPALCGSAREQLRLADRIGLADDLMAHFERGVLPADGLLDGLFALLDDPASGVQVAALHHLDAVARRLLPDSHRGGFSALVRDRLEPLAARLFDAPSADPTHAEALLTLLVDAECRTCRPRLEAHAELALADSTWRPAWAGVVLPLAATWADERLFARLRAALDADPPAARRAVLIAAIGRCADPHLTQQALEALPWRRLRGVELLDLLRPMARHRGRRDQIRQFIEQHFDALMHRFGAAILTRLPELARDARTASERSAWATLFTSPRLRPPGMAPAVRRMLAIIDRNLRQAADASTALRVRLAQPAVRPS